VCSCPSLIFLFAYSCCPQVLSNKESRRVQRPAAVASRQRCRLESPPKSRRSFPSRQNPNTVRCKKNLQNYRATVHGMLHPTDIVLLLCSLFLLLDHHGDTKSSNKVKSSTKKSSLSTEDHPPTTSSKTKSKHRKFQRKMNPRIACLLTAFDSYSSALRIYPSRQSRRSHGLEQESQVHEGAPT
jgi:hypothetical protein